MIHFPFEIYSGILVFGNQIILLIRVFLHVKEFKFFNAGIVVGHAHQFIPPFLNSDIIIKLGIATGSSKRIEGGLPSPPTLLSAMEAGFCHQFYGQPAPIRGTTEKG